MFGALLAALTAVNRSTPRARRAGRGPGAPSGDPVVDAQRAVRADPDSAAAYAGSATPTFSAPARPAIPASTRAPAARSRAALRRDPRELGALVGAGTLAGLRHDFGEQLRLGMEARRVAPGLARPLTVVADAQIELGRYGGAARSIQRLVDTEARPRLLLARLLPPRAAAATARRGRGDAPRGVRRRRLAREPRLRPGAPRRPRARARPTARRRATPTWRAALRAGLPPGPRRARARGRRARRPASGRRPPAARHATCSRSPPA